MTIVRLLAVPTEFATPTTTAAAVVRPHVVNLYETKDPVDPNAFD